jgi:hypothetical protein
MVTTTVSRNDPCPCRSGKKYKHCCLRAQPATFENRVLPTPALRQDGGSPISFAPRQAATRPAITTPVEKRVWQQVDVTLDEPTGDLICASLIYSREWLQSRNAVVLIRENLDSICAGLRR